MSIIEIPWKRPHQIEPGDLAMRVIASTLTLLFFALLLIVACLSSAGIVSHLKILKDLEISHNILVDIVNLHNPNTAPTQSQPDLYLGLTRK